MPAESGPQTMLAMDRLGINGRSPLYQTGTLTRPSNMNMKSPKGEMDIGHFTPKIMSPNQNQNQRLLQLAERSALKGSSNNCTPNSSNSKNFLSFRKIRGSSPSPAFSFANPNTPVKSPYSSPISQTPSPLSSGLGGHQARPILRQNPKMYTSFAAKGSSKLKKAFIKSDPLKTNIEHLVFTPSPARGSSVQSDQSETATASFHDRLKLASAFGPRQPDILQDCMTVRKMAEEVKGRDSGEDANANWQLTKVERKIEVSSAAQIVSLSSSHPKGKNFHQEGRRKDLLHSLSFSAKEKEKAGGDGGSGSGYGYKKMVSRKPEGSRSLPKSFLNGRKRSALKDACTSAQEELRVEILEEKVQSSLVLSESDSPHSESSTSGAATSASESGESDKMRWQKSAGSSSRDARPKSFDYSQRKAWMKYYREVEMNSVPGESSHLPTPPPSCRGQGQRSGEEGQGTLTFNPSVVMESPGRGPPPTSHPSLFQRFSKTFSLRFGADKGGKRGGVVGKSSPDLPSFDPESGKLRKVKSKLVREEKCQSGDSGIEIEGRQGQGHDLALGAGARLRRIRSEYLEPSAASLNHLSLVEIPDEVWSPKAQREDLRVPIDDGFSSGEDSGNGSGSARSEETYHNSTNYHSLPHRKGKGRKGPSVEDEVEGQGSSGPGSGRTRSFDSEEGVSGVLAKVLREILLTEQNYVKTLNDLVQGFLFPCRRRKDLFSEETVRNIFSNLEELLRFHAKFLEELKEDFGVEKVAGSFVKYSERFGFLYSDYCCNHPISMGVVRGLRGLEYQEFFEACRRLQLMDKLPLHGFLLRPIQRICQYHLQLAELQKHVGQGQGQEVVERAVEAMRGVALRVNEEQRLFDKLQEVVKVQDGVEGWEGPDLLQNGRNVELLCEGDLVKTALGKKNKEVHCFLLNKDLIYCKKDYVKKGGFVFDGRIDLEVGVWLNIDSNEEDEYFGMVHNSFRLYSHCLKTWILFTASSPAEKRRWITALEMTLTPRTVDPRLCSMAALSAKLSKLESNKPVSQNLSSNSNTLPKSKKKGKPTNPVPPTPEAMLIEVSRLKRPNYSTGTLQLQKEHRSSKFYV